ncbi:MAG: hypothetical protein Q9222_002521, partial [Ikaeria aurantiellina]
VLIGFLATAYLTLLLVIVYYLMDCVEDEYLNDIDKMVLSKLSPRKYFGSLRNLETSLRRVVLIFSDQQVVTGIALLGSGYGQLKSGNGIDSYHWQIVVYLAWFSSLTPLTTLTMLRYYFLRNPGARLGRALLMLITVMMLGVALLPTGDRQWFISSYYNSMDYAGIPALCYFRRLDSQDYKNQLKYGDLAAISMLISILVLAFGYLTRIIKLSDRANKASKRWLRDRPSQILRSIRDGALRCAERQVPNAHKMHWMIGYIVTEASYVWLKALSDVYGSMLWEILWLMFALAWGTRNLFIARNLLTISEETAWGFGQWFPVILLVLPLLSTVETFYEKEASSPQHSVTQDHANLGNATVTTSSIGRMRASSKIIRVGHWLLGEGSSLSTASVPLQDLHTVTRTGTDLQAEEQSMGVVRRETQPNLPGAPSGETNEPATEGITSPHQPLDCYNFEWFWILVLTILLSVLAAIIFVLSIIETVLELWYVILTAIAWILIPSFGYTLIFVTISKYHAALGAKVEMYLRVSRQKQRSFLRVAAWCWLPIFLAAMIGIMVFLSLLTFA